MMSDSDSKPSIPSWQQQHSTSSPSSDSGDASDSADRSTLIEQASKFLQDDAIRDAPTDRKITFLESKGLTSTEIDTLLGVSRNAEASSNGSSDSNSSNPAEESKDISTEPASQAVSSSMAPTPSESKQTNANSTAPRDVPPIITYPEFLLHQSKPPPLVTLRSVLYTLYGTAGLGATIYGASEYLVKPMIAILTDARLDLAQTTEENLRKLNEKLEQNVSQIPPSLLASSKHTTSASADDASQAEDSDSMVSDPTELFHRDIGTQTTQDLIEPPPSSTKEETTPPDPHATTNTHTSRLSSIADNLRSLEESSSQSTTLHDTTRSRIADLQRYLDSLLYSKNSYPYTATTGYGVYSTPGIDSGSAAATGVGKAEEDAISGFRAEIRGVKGALLSARNFPSGRGAGFRSSFAR